MGIYETNIDWNEVVTARPANPRNPADPAYRWDTRVDRALAQANRYRIRVALLLQHSPPWANGGHESAWAPDPRKFADFADRLRAVTRRQITELHRPRASAPLVEW